MSGRSNSSGGFLFGLLALGIAGAVIYGGIGWLRDFDESNLCQMSRHPIVGSPSGLGLIHVHSGSGAEYEVVGGLTSGESVCPREYATSTTGERWVRIRYGDGLRGWIRTSSINSSPPEPDAPYWARPVPESLDSTDGGGGSSLTIKRLDEVSNQLAPGFSRTSGVADEVAVLSRGSPHSWRVNLTSGVDYRIVGACGEGCSDLDLFILDLNGAMIDTHESSAGDPVLRFQVSENGRYEVRLLGHSCADAGCVGGARLLN